MAEVNWRDSNDYRTKYFRANPGLFGFLYICSQCGKPMINKKRIAVDHIFPPSKAAIKWKSFWGTKYNTSPVATALNRGFNTVAICHSCNSRKSDKVNPLVTGRGIIAKILETTLFSLQKVLAYVAWAAYSIIHWTLRKLFAAASAPLRNKGLGWKNKVLVIVCYVALGYILYRYIT